MEYFTYHSGIGGYMKKLLFLSMLCIAFGIQATSVGITESVPVTSVLHSIDNQHQQQQ